MLTAPAPLVSAGGLSSGPLGAVQAADREIVRQTALRARAVAAFTATRPSSADRPQGTPGAMSAERRAARPDVLRPVSEWATQELAVALSISSQAAEALFERSLTLVHRLPLTLAALEASSGHRCPGAVVARSPTTRALRTGAGPADLGGGTGDQPAQLSEKARREVLQRSVRAAADRLAEAVRERCVSARPGPHRRDERGVRAADPPEAAVLVKALGAYADALSDDGRTRGQRTADCLLDLVLRPGEDGLPPVRVRLDVVAPVGALLGEDQPCEIDGQVVPAEVVRALLTALTGTRRSAPSTAIPPARRPVTPLQPAPRTSTSRSRAPRTMAPDPDFVQWWTGTVRRVLVEELTGWHHRLAPDGTFTVTTPTGLTATTTPPPC
ncbi:hypothetical protein [Geodermatophilus sp. SYSU D01036]